MNKGPLRIPVALAWTAMAGAGLGAALSCSNQSQAQPTPYCVGVVDGALEVLDIDASAGCPDGDTLEKTVVS
jgi:hypothetical protein